MDNISMPSIILENPVDAHTHLRGVLSVDAAGIPGARSNSLLRAVSSLQIAFSQVLAMPNIGKNHIHDAATFIEYSNLVQGHMTFGQIGTTPMMTLSLKTTTTPDIIRACGKTLRAVKYYPGGVTTGSGVATPDIDPIDLKMKGVFEAMAELGIPLSLHPETTLLTDVHGQITKGFVADAEREFETIAEQIASNHPNLKVIIEHISTKDMADLIGNDKYQNIYGTVTPQHLLYTDHDKQGGHAYLTHLHCKPTIKNPADLQAIQKLVFSAHPRIFFGSDSAPHPQDAKECAHCSSGVFSSPIALQTLATWFMAPQTHAWYKSLTNEDITIIDAERRLKAFVSENNKAVYSAQEGYTKYVTLENTGFTIPKFYRTNTPDLNIVPMPIVGQLAKLAVSPNKEGQDTLPWSISNITLRTTEGSERILNISRIAG